MCSRWAISGWCFSPPRRLPDTTRRTFVTTASEHGGVQFHASEFHSGQTIFVQGDPGDRVYLITEGKVKISFRGPTGRTNVRAIIGAGDIFGELAVFDAGPRACTATAITEVRTM